LRERPGGHDEAALRTAGYYHAIQLADGTHADRGAFTISALDQKDA
jgi:hypothetical protein